MWRGVERLGVGGGGVKGEWSYFWVSESLRSVPRQPSLRGAGSRLGTARGLAWLLL